MTEDHNTVQAPEAIDQQKLQETIQWLGLPEDAGERAVAVSRINTDKLISAVAVLHSVLAPEADLNPTKGAMYVGSPDGTDKRQLVPPEDRLKIFEHVTHLTGQLAKRIHKSASQAYLDRAANVIALGIVLAHPFEDGNGRTARVLAHLIRNGYDGSEKARDDIRVLGENRPSQGFRINSYVPTLEGRDMSPIELLNAAASIDVALEAKQLYEMSTRSEFTTPYS
jgi:hypothetical protein